MESLSKIPAVSKKHAAIAMQNGRIIIVDQNSANGTFINGRRLDKPTQLQPGQKLTIGPAEFRLLRGAVKDASSRSLTPLYLGLGALALLILFLALSSGNRGGSRGTLLSEPNPIRVSDGDASPLSHTVDVQPGKISETGLSDGASVTLISSPSSEATTLTMNRLTDAEAQELAQAAGSGQVVGAVYDIELADRGGMLAAQLVLPYYGAGLSIEQQEQITAAYFSDGRWISVPTTINTADQTITAEVSHFSFWTPFKRGLGFNKAPEVRIDPDPENYYSEDTVTLEGIEDLTINVYATDDKDKIQAVYLATEVAFIEDLTLKKGWHDLAAKAKEDCEHEADKAGDFCTMIVDEFLSPPQKDLRHLTWFELPRKAGGTYQHIVKPSQIKTSGEGSLAVGKGSLAEIHVHVLVLDDLVDSPVEESATITFFPKEHSPAIELIGPGPTEIITCPAQPILRWQTESDLIGERGGSLQIRVSKKNDLWETNSFDVKEDFDYRDDFDFDDPRQQIQKDVFFKGEWQVTKRLLTAVTVGASYPT